MRERDGTRQVRRRRRQPRRPWPRSWPLAADLAAVCRPGGHPVWSFPPDVCRIAPAIPVTEPRLAAPRPPHDGSAGRLPSRLGSLLALAGREGAQGAVKSLGVVEAGDPVEIHHGPRRTFSRGQGSPPSIPDGSHDAASDGPNRRHRNPDPMSHPNRTKSKPIPSRATQDSQVECRGLTPWPPQHASRRDARV
jgi:hypothetical protein